MNITLSVVVVGIALFSSIHLSCTSADEPKWPIDVLLEEDFIIYTSVDSIPKRFTDAVSIPGDVTASANPGEYFNDTFNDTDDAVNDLSTWRLKFAGHSGNYWFIYYEKETPYGKEDFLALFDLTKMQRVPWVELSFLGSLKAPDLTVLRHYIVSAKTFAIVR